jgi:hypothetical protein
VVNESLITAVATTAKTATPLIVEGLKKFAQGISYFVYLPLKMFGLQVSPFFAQLIYLGVLTAIIYKLTNSWTWTFIIILILLLIGAIA